MKKVVVFNGSPRKNGNTVAMVSAFREGVRRQASGGPDEPVHSTYHEFQLGELQIKNCTGCLRCNILKRCSLRGDDWERVSADILDADVLVFASPVYFHHVTAPMKNLIDRFRSFVHVQITETGIQHTPHQEWNKDFVLLLPMGSSDDSDAQPVVDLFEYMCEILGKNNRLHVIKGTRLAVTNHILKSEEELKTLYPKLGLPLHLAAIDAQRNAALLAQCRELAAGLVASPASSAG